MDFQAPPSTNSPSFIPKRPSSFGVHSESQSSVGIFMFLGVILFLVSAIAYGGVLLMSASVDQSIKDSQAQIDHARKNFGQDKVDALNDMTRLDLKLRVAQTLLDQHVTLLPLFADLEADTYQSVRFKTFKFVRGDDGKSTIKLSGEAKNYSDFNNFNNYVPVALQAGKFAGIPNVKNVVFSDLNLDQNGNVIFNVSADLDPKFISYRENRHLQ